MLLGVLLCVRITGYIGLPRSRLDLGLSAGIQRYLFVRRPPQTCVYGFILPRAFRLLQSSATNDLLPVSQKTLRPSDRPESASLGVPSLIAASTSSTCPLESPRPASPTTFRPRGPPPGACGAAGGIFRLPVGFSRAGGASSRCSCAAFERRGLFARGGFGSNHPAQPGSPIFRRPSSAADPPRLSAEGANRMLLSLSRPLSRRGGRAARLSPASPPLRSTGPPVPLLPLPARLAPGSGNPLCQGLDLPSPV